MLMYLALQEHIYLSFCQGKLFLLDAKKDQYIVLKEKIVAILVGLLDLNVSKENSKYLSQRKNIDKYVKYFIKQGILCPQLSQKKIMLDIHLDNKGMYSIPFKMPRNTLDTKVHIVEILTAYLMLIQTFCLLHIFGMWFLLKMIKRKKQNMIKKNKLKRYLYLTACLNQACVFFPIRVKCLEWAFAFVLFSLKKGLPCNVVIGIQNTPFSSHAWVETLDRKVIGDQKRLPLALTTILREPFGVEYAQEFR